MLTNSDRTVLYGLAAFIAYQVYKCCNQGVAGGGGCGSPAPLSGQAGTPGWVQQLSSQLNDGEDLFTPSCGIFGRCQ